MEFKQLAKLVADRFAFLGNSYTLYRSSISGDELVDIYLGVLEKDGEIFLHPESSIHRSKDDMSFIRQWGNTVAIDKDYSIITLWDLAIPKDSEYYPAAKAMDKALSEAIIKDRLYVDKDELLATYKNNTLGMVGKVSTSKAYDKQPRRVAVFTDGRIDSTKSTMISYDERLGLSKDLQMEDRIVKVDYAKAGIKFDEEGNSTRTFYSFYATLPDSVITSSPSAATLIGDLNTIKELFEKGLAYPLELFIKVKSWIDSDRMWNVQASQKEGLNLFIKLKEEASKVSEKGYPNWLWEKVSTHTHGLRLINTGIGVPVTRIGTVNDEGKPWNDDNIINAWNIEMAPDRYKKAQAEAVSVREKEAAVKYLTDQGYVTNELNSFDRKFASYNDVRTSDVFHRNHSKVPKKVASVFDTVSVKPTGKVELDSFKNATPISVESFMGEVLEGADGVDILFTPNMVKNLVTITSLTNPRCKDIIKGDSQMGLTYKGNLSGVSSLTKAVQDQGGKVDGVLRFSLEWSHEGLDGNDKRRFDDSDLDLHVVEPNGSKVYYSNKSSRTGGFLDLDKVSPSGHKNNQRSLKQEPRVVENICYPDAKAMVKGDYEVWVVPFSVNNSQGFEMEILMDGQMFHYKWDTPFNHSVSSDTLKGLKVATVHYDNFFSITHHIPYSQGAVSFNQSTQWGIDTHQFHPCTLIANGPNHWGDSEVGRKDWLFMVGGCKPDEPIRTFHVDQLVNDLSDKAMRRFLEVWGKEQVILPSDEALGGFGFSNNRGKDGKSLNNAVVRVRKDNSSKVYNIHF
jgi:hypothetical protein